MIKRAGILGMAIFFALGISQNLLAQGNPYDKYLTASDIEKITGFAGVKQVARNPQQGAGGHLNFADQNGNMILIASFLTSDDFQAYKSEENMVKTFIQGIGDEAFVGPGSSDPQYMLLVRKGDKCVALSTFINPDDPLKTQIAMPQLIALGKIVVDRM
jgi:hypothetical protein